MLVRTTRHRRTFVLAAALGTAFSLALAAAGPLVLPAPATVRYADASTSRGRSWLWTVYQGSYGGTTDESEGPAEGLRAVDEARGWRTYGLTQAQWVGLPVGGGGPGAYVAFESGFPFRSLAAWRAERVGWRLMTQYVAHAVRSPRFIALSPAAGDDPIKARWVPRVPMWPGLIANALFWSAAAWALLAGPRAAVRWRRRRLGLCPACAYDLHASPAGSPCPECGGP